MIKIITNNLVVKIICLLLATALWTYVVSGEAKIDTFPGTIPLKVKNNPENLVVVKDVNNVELRIMAEKGIWKKLSVDSFDSYIDLADLSEGIHEIPVTVKTNIEGVQIMAIKPAKILVRLEPMVSKTVPVNIKIEGNAAEGMITGEPILDPGKVDISGAKSIIDEISQVIAVIKLDGESEKIEKNIPLIALDSANTIIENIQFNPSNILLTLPIIKADKIKTVGIKVKTEGYPKAGFWVSQIIINPSIISITSANNELININYLETQPIDISGLDSDKKQTVGLEIPSGINLLDEKKTKVDVEIKLSATESQKDVIGTLKYLNLVNNLSVINIDPNTIKILLSGPADKLKDIDGSKVNIDLDLASYNGSGTYAKDISKEMISAPEGIQVNSFVPSSIRITLGNK